MKIVAVFCFLLLAVGAFTQPACPPNIGFENGNFDNWQPFTGHILSDGTINVRAGSRTQILYKNTGFIEKDPYGHFPVISPNGSLYSVKIGDDGPDVKAERLVYSFSVPPNADAYSIIFNYAIVLQNPNHQEYEQPRFTVRVFNETRSAYIECSSFDFVAGFNQPDFLLSDVNVDIFYKPWSSATINLSAFRGERLRLEFTVTDCTRGGHFGYAYFDVVEKCRNAVTGNIICPGTEKVSLQAPVGFAGYQWYTGDFGRQLSTDNLYTVSQPNVGDSFAIVLLPYAYLGCQDTVYAKITAVADPIRLSVKNLVEGCNDKGVDLTSPAVTQGSSASLQLEYFTDSTATKYLPDAKNILASGVYFIKGTNPSGCVQMKPVDVVVSPIPVFGVAMPPVTGYPEVVNLTALPDDPQLFYTYWENKELTREVLLPSAVSQSGIYYIKGSNSVNCSSVQPVNVKIKPLVLAPNAFTPNQDGKNDRFLYKALGGLKKIAFFKVYNRWGAEVFSTNKVGAGWDGTYKGKPAESGTYVWILQATDWLNKSFAAKGTVVLIR